MSTVKTPVDAGVTKNRPERLIYSETDSEASLRDALIACGIEQMTPHRIGRKEHSRQDIHPLLRRYFNRIDSSYCRTHQLQQILCVVLKH